MTIEYSKYWSLTNRQPVQVITETQARKRFDKRDEHCALIGGGEEPTHVIVFGGRTAVVYFMDEVLRAALQYDFIEVEPTRLFLDQATFREYAGQSGDVTRAIRFTFAVNGGLTVIESDLRADTESVVEKSTSVSANWEPFPAFADYASLCRENRVAAR